MDIESSIKNMEQSIKVLSKQLDNLKQSYFTSVFLQSCEKHGINLVSIGQKTNLIKSCKDWPFGYVGSVFADERSENGWPAIWAVCDEMKIGFGAGNTGQHQANLSKLINGVYKLEDGKWLKIE